MVLKDGTKEVFVPGAVFVKDVIEYLEKLEPSQTILSQAILPDGTAWNAPFQFFEILQSKGQDGNAIIGLQIRCDNNSPFMPER